VRWGKIKRLPVSSLEFAVELYYSNPELTTADIMNLFSCSIYTARNYKKSIRKAMEENKIYSNELYSVDTRFAYEVWGIDIKDYQKRLKDLKKYKEGN